jgi:hypothetical protein
MLLPRIIGISQESVAQIDITQHVAVVSAEGLPVGICNCKVRELTTLFYKYPVMEPVAETFISLILSLDM